jgi:dolichol-phosphate mannosyltransferase
MASIEENASRGLVVIPTYNEAINVPALIPAVLNQGPLDILVVDDGSPDGTAGLVRALMAKDPRIRIIERQSKQGLGTAYVAGFKFAIQQKYRYVFEMDADFSHDPQALPVFLERIKEADLVIGSRYTNGVRVLNWPINRLLLSYFANVYTRFLTRMPVHDATGGFKCYKLAVLEAIDLEKIRSNGYAFQIEMSYKAWRKGFQLEEIPIIFSDRQAGASKMSKNIVYEAFFMLLKLRLMSLFGKL